MPNSPTPNAYGYNAEATDFETGMQYLRARYYDTGISRFFQEDDYRGRFTEPETLNRYMHTAGNPVNYIDPSGYDVSSRNYFDTDYLMRFEDFAEEHLGYHNLLNSWSLDLQG